MSSHGTINLTDQVDLLYVCGIGGWSDLYVISPHGKISVRMTHVFGDPIVELSSLCCSLLRGEIRSMARLRDEPGLPLVTASVTLSNGIWRAWSTGIAAAGMIFHSRACSF